MSAYEQRHNMLRSGLNRMNTDLETNQPRKRLTTGGMKVNKFLSDWKILYKERLAEMCYEHISRNV